MTTSSVWNRSLNSNELLTGAKLHHLQTDCTWIYQLRMNTRWRKCKTAAEDERTQRHTNVITPGFTQFSQRRMNEDSSLTKLFKQRAHWFLSDLLMTCCVLGYSDTWIRPHVLCVSVAHRRVIMHESRFILKVEKQVFRRQLQKNTRLWSIFVLIHQWKASAWYLFSIWSLNCNKVTKFTEILWGN